jgi:transposase
VTCTRFRGGFVRESIMESRCAMNRRKHSNEFKMEAVRLAERGDVPVRQVARDLAISESLLHKWINQFGKRPDGSRVTADEHEELIRLRRENRLLREERDILKKATAFFARQSQ